MTHPAHQAKPSPSRILATFALASASFLAAPAYAQMPSVVASPFFTTGNLVVLVEGCGVYNGTCLNVPNGTGTGLGNSSATGYGDNQAAPITLFQFTPIGTTSATYVNSLVLPQTNTIAPYSGNFPVSGEYGSSSEGTVQLSGSGQFLSFAGYAVPFAQFNANPALYGAAPSLALAQSTSVGSSTTIALPRVIALVDKNGNVNSGTGIYNIFNLNNPRSVYTVNGTTAYISGQGSGSDATGGVFATPINPYYRINSAPQPITGLDTTGNTISQDTRTVQVYNGTLYTSVDSKGGSGSARSYIGTLGTPGTLPTGTVGAPVMLNGFGNTGGTGKVTITTGANSNGNNLNAGVQINLSPSNFFFASPSILYVADTGNPKNNSTVTTGNSIGDGGLQKWINSAADGTGTWNLAYTLYKGLGPLGLGPVPNTAGTGTSGLYGLTGSVTSGSVQLFATNATIADLDQTYLYGITDTLSFTTASQASGETFSQLAAAPSDSNFKGVSFTPTVAPPIVPTITWNTPAAINYGSALSDVQLNATTTVPGTFTYTLPIGYVPPAGQQTVYATFTPTDPITYASTTVSNTITVNASSALPANLVTTRVITRSGDTLYVQITIANTGQTDAAGVTLTSVRIGSTSATTLPQLLGVITAGNAVSDTILVPGSAGASGAASSVTITGVTNIGTFGSSSRVTLP